MIISRRKVHLFSSIALAIIMPVVFIAGILLRPTYATVSPDLDQLLSQSTSHTTSHTTIGQPSTQDISEQNPIAAFLQP